MVNKYKSVDKYCESILHSNCSRCYQLVLDRRQIVTHRGNPSADVVIIGRNPGAQEDQLGKPFTGPAGQLLDTIIEYAGFNPNKDFFLSNSVLCYTEGNRVPTNAEMINCSDHLQGILSYFDTVIATGRFAILAVMYALDREVYAKNHRKSATALLTNGRPYNIAGKTVFGTYHPSYLLRQGILDDTHDKFVDFAREIKLAKETAKNSDYKTNTTNIHTTATLW